MFLAGYGTAYTPPPGRADTSNSSVGYDVYDRFDLGKPGNPTLYGTETGLKQFANVLHRFDGRLNIDAVLNHNAYSDNDYVNPQFTSFQQAGGYPGFVLQNPDGGTDPAGVAGTFGDFHNPSFTDYQNGQLSGLLDIDHSTNWQLIRQPVATGNPQNIPAGVTPWVGRLANVPDPANARFYPDKNLPGVTYYDPASNQNLTVYPFNLANPMAGDAAAENATGLEMRYLQWMVQTVGVDGFRLDAAKHMTQSALKYFDAAVYRSNPRLQLDGSVENVFMYGEVVPGDGQPAGQSSQDFLYSYIRKDISPATPNVIGGDRDVLDFVLRGNLSANLSNNGTANDWRNVVNSSMDVREQSRRRRGRHVECGICLHSDAAWELDCLLQREAVRNRTVVSRGWAGRRAGKLWGLNYGPSQYSRNAWSGRLSRALVGERVFRNGTQQEHAGAAG
jgi:glycosidase